jgi:hypothetical protein
MNANDSRNAELLARMNNVRLAWSPNKMTAQNVGLVGTFLKLLLAEEEGHNPISLASIFITHLDQLVEEIIGFSDGELPRPGPRRWLHRLASALQFKWQRRFKEAYFSINENRIKEMKENGALRNIVPNVEGTTASDIWRAATIIPLSDIEPGT